MNNLVEIGKFGKTFGLKGELALRLSTDFPEAIKKNIKLYTNTATYTVERYILERSLLKLKEVHTVDEAKMLTNQTVYMSKDDTLEFCELEEGEYFWFDLEGALVFEGELLLGKIVEIERIGNADYVIVKTDSKLLPKYTKSFLIPYIERYVLEFDKEQKKLFVKDALSILEES